MRFVVLYTMSIFQKDEDVAFDTLCTHRFGLKDNCSSTFVRGREKALPRPGVLGIGVMDMAVPVSNNAHSLRNTSAPHNKESHVAQ